MHKLTLQNITIESRLHPHVPNVMGDLNQLQQCIINLIFNAIDAMPQGGVLTLESDLRDRGDLVEIRVTDTGCGIDKKDLPYIFDPFFTTKKREKEWGLGFPRCMRS